MSTPALGLPGVGRRRQPGQRRARTVPRAPARRPVARPRAATATGVAALTPWLLWSTAALALWFVVFAGGLSALQEHHQQRLMYAHLRQQLAKATAPISGTIPEGTPIAVLAGPHLGASVVVEGTSSAALRAGPGHLPASVLPGQAGVATLLGKSVTYGAPFAGVTDLHAGDVLTVTTGQGVFHYAVNGVRRAGEPVPPALTSGHGRLTLVTAQRGGWASGFTVSQAVYVDADLQSAAAPFTARSATLTSADLVMHTDQAGLFPLVLWMQLLLITALAMAWFWRRTGPGQTWLLGSPVLLAALWGASSAVSELLPNLV